MSGEENHEAILQSLRGSVEQELARLGRREALRVEGTSLVLGRGAKEARTDLAGTVAQWDNLPEDLRERRVRQVAELLAQQGSARAPASVRPQRGRHSNWLVGLLSFVKPVLIVVVFLASMITAYRYLAPQGQARWASLTGLFHAVPGSSSIAPTIASLTAREPERAVIASKSCGEAQTRVARGAAIGPADVEGWQVELVLLARGSHADSSTAPALAQFVRRKPGASNGSVIWPGATSLVEAERFDAQVEIQPFPSLGEQHLSGVRLLFSGPYVLPYFSEDLRGDYFKLADALADALQATDGALYAHCASSDVHQIGSWFLGASPGAAVASLLYFMGSFSDPPLLKATVLGSPNDPRRHDLAFDAISQAATGLDRSRVSSLLGNELGMISGRPGKPSRITFAFRDANRASRASAEAAGALRLGRPR